MIAGKPISSSARSASGRFLTWRERGVSRPILVIASRNRSRSSALSIASAVAPIISTSNFSSVPSLRKRQRAVQRGLAAHGRQQREAAGNDVAFLLDDLGDDLRRDRLDIGRVRQFRIGHDRGRIGIDQDDPVALLLQRLDRLGAGIVELAGLADHDRTGADDEDRRDVSTFGHSVSLVRRAGNPGTKKGRAAARPLTVRRRAGRARGLSLDQIPEPGKGLERPINRQMALSPGAAAEIRCASGDVGGPAWT